MPEKPKEDDVVEKDLDEKCDPEDKSSWSEDQKNHEYYYDDAHGYEVYEPEEDPSDPVPPTPIRER
jgi:hypothetical protein